MTTNDRSIAEQLPDLPALESAEAGASIKTWIALFYLAFLVFMVAPCVYIYWKARPFFGDQFALASGAVGLVSMLILWIVVRVLSGVFSWRTDAQGLMMRGPLVRRFVAWQDVEDAESNQGASSLCYHLRTSGGVVRVNVEGGYESPSVYASIWQHLRRHGRAGDLQLPEAAFTFWDQIPDELPNAIEWTNPRPPKLWATVVSILVFTGFLALGAVVSFMDGNWFMKGVMAIAGLGFVFMIRSVLRDSLRTAASVSVTDDRIEGHTSHRTVTLPWTEVTSARWAHNVNSSSFDILVTGRNPSDRVSIPHVISSDESGQLILAIIRRLRTAGVSQALTIPEELRAQAGPARIEPQAQDSTTLLAEPAEVRLTVRERLLIMLLPAFLGLVIVLGHPPDESIRPALVSVPIAIGLLAATWFASGTYAVRADSEGIRKKFLGLGRLIRWDDIAEYSICPVFKRAVRNHRVLKDSDGKILTELSLSFGAREARNRFWSILDARLSQSWASTKPAEPWKSRPWTPS